MYCYVFGPYPSDSPTTHMPQHAHTTTRTRHNTHMHSMQHIHNHTTQSHNTVTRTHTCSHTCTFTPNNHMHSYRHSNYIHTVTCTQTPSHKHTQTHTHTATCPCTLTHSYLHTNTASESQSLMYSGVLSTLSTLHFHCVLPEYFAVYSCLQHQEDRLWKHYALVSLAACMCVHACACVASIGQDLCAEPLKWLTTMTKSPSHSSVICVCMHQSHTCTILLT